MKKLFLIFAMAAVSAFGQNIKVANPATPAQNILSGVTINNSTNLVVPGTLTVSGLTSFNGNFTGIGADYLLNNQTLTGNGSIITRSLGDARYAGISDAFSTNSSYVYTTGTTQSFYNAIVRNDATVFGGTTTSNLLVYGTLRVSNTVNFISTGLTWAFDGTRQVMGTNDGSGNFNYEVRLDPNPTNPLYTRVGNFQSSSTTLSLESSGDVQVVIDNNNNDTTKNFYIRRDGTNGPVLYAINESHQATNYGSLDVTNNFSASGIDSRLPNQTLASGSNIMTRSLSETFHWSTHSPYTQPVFKQAAMNTEMSMNAPDAPNSLLFAYSNMWIKSVHLFAQDNGVYDTITGATNMSVKISFQTTAPATVVVLDWTPASFISRRTPVNYWSGAWFFTNKTQAVINNVDAQNLTYEVRFDGATNATVMQVYGTVHGFMSVSP